jgi:hypothetical protein
MVLSHFLDRPVIVSWDGVVIRGQGADTTKIVFRYGSPAGGVGFFQLKEDTVVGPDTPLEVHAEPEGLCHIAILAQGRVLAERVRHRHWGGTFMLRTLGSSLRRLQPGTVELVVVAEWENGRRAESEVTVWWDPEKALPAGARRMPSSGLA